MMSLRLALLALVALSTRSALGDSSRNLQAAAASAAASEGGPFGGGSSTSTAAVGGGGNQLLWGRRLQGLNFERRGGRGGRGGASTSTSTSTSRNAAAGAAAAASGGSTSTTVAVAVGRRLEADTRGSIGSFVVNDPTSGGSVSGLSERGRSGGARYRANAIAGTYGGASRVKVSGGRRLEADGGTASGFQVVDPLTSRVVFGSSERGRSGGARYKSNLVAGSFGSVSRVSAFSG